MILIVRLHHEPVLREQATPHFPVKLELAGGSAGICANGLAGTRGRGPGGWFPWGTPGEASLPGMPPLEGAHRQRAIGGDTLVGHHAEPFAGRQAGIFHEQFEIVTRGKILAQLPRANGGNGNAQILGNRLERNLALPPPVSEGGRKAAADVTVKLRLLDQGKRLNEFGAQGKPKEFGFGPAGLYLALRG